MSKRRKMSLEDIIKWAMLSIVLLAIFACIAFFAIFTNGFKSEFKEFYVTIESEHMSDHVMQSRSKMTVDLGTTYKVTAKYTFGFLDKGAVRGYDVAAFPNNPSEDKLVYLVDGDVTDYMTEKDLLSFLNIERDETSFKFTVNADLPELIQSLHPDSSVVGVPNAVNSDAAFITLIVYSEDKTQSIALDLILSAAVATVELDKSQIVF